MKISNTRQCQIFSNVCEFAAVHPEIYPPDSYGRQLVSDLGAVVRDAARLTASQTSGIGSARGKSTAKARAREALRQSLASMAATARGITVTHPEIDTQFRLPLNVDDAALLNSGRTFATDAAPLVDAFVNFGLPPTFIEDLTSKIKALERASVDHKNMKETHVAATSAIHDVIEKGRVILQQLDPITRNNLRDNTLMLSKWDRVRRVSRPATSSRRSEAEVDPVTATSESAHAPGT